MAVSSSLCGYGYDGIGSDCKAESLLGRYGLQPAEGSDRSQVILGCGKEFSDSSARDLTLDGRSLGGVDSRAVSIGLAMGGTVKCEPLIHDGDKSSRNTERFPGFAKGV